MIAAGSARPTASGKRPRALPDEALAELAEMWDGMGCAVWLRNAAGRLVYANVAASGLFGIPLGGPTTEPAGPILDEDGRVLRPDQLPSAVALRTGLPQRHQITGILLPGRPPRWVVVDAVPKMDDSGHVQSVLSTAVDITAFKQAQIALHVSEDRYRRILETMHEGCCLLSASGEITFVNRRLCDMLGWTPAELQGRRATDVLGAASGSLVQPGRRAGAPAHREVALRRKDGGTIWATVSGAPMVDDDGHTTAILAMFTDVTERRQSQERALAAAAKIEQLTADAIYTVDAERRVCSWNQGAERLFGWTKDEVLGQPTPLIPPERVAGALESIKRIISTGTTITRESVRTAKSGRQVAVIGSWSPVPLEDGSTGVLCILKDISDHKAIHDQLREQAQALALLRERERIAMDLHDGVTQSLYGVALSLGALRRRGGDAAHQESVLGGAINQLTEVIQGIRDYIFELRTGVPEGVDLESGLRAKVQELVAASGVTPRLAVQADTRRLSADKVNHMLYIVHEALSNVARHARATEVAIEVLPWGSGIMLSITDNGRGFDSGQRGRRATDGLRNMRERAGELGAILSIDSSPGVGTTVRVQVP